MTNDQVTLNQLYESCKALVDAGYGERKIIVLGDNEGNSYHGMFNLPTPVTKADLPYLKGLVDDNQEKNLLNTIVVG